MKKESAFLLNLFVPIFGCELSFNNLEKTWDCPCHGSRYEYNGKVICEPAIHSLEKIEYFDN